MNCKLLLPGIVAFPIIFLQTLLLQKKKTTKKNKQKNITIGNNESAR